MPGMFPAIGSAMGAEDVRDLQFGTMHWSPSLAGPVLSLHKQIKWAGDVLDRAVGRYLQHAWSDTQYSQVVVVGQSP